MRNCPNKDCRGNVSHGVCEKCKKNCGCSFNATCLNDFCNYHRPKFSRGMQLYSQADIDEAKEIATLGVPMGE